MESTIGNLFLYLAIGGGILFLVTLGFVTVEERIRRD